MNIEPKILGELLGAEFVAGAIAAIPEDATIDRTRIDDRMVLAGLKRAIVALCEHADIRKRTVIDALRKERKARAYLFHTDLEPKVRAYLETAAAVVTIPFVLHAIGYADMMQMRDIRTRVGRQLRTCGWTILAQLPAPNRQRVYSRAHNVAMINVSDVEFAELISSLQEVG